MTPPHYDANAGKAFLCAWRNGSADSFCETRIFKEIQEGEKKEGPTARLWFTEAGEETDLVQRHVRRGEHVYIGVAARRENEGDKKGLLYTDYVWAEMDFKEYAGGEQEARARLAAYDKAPTMIVHSGGGLHVYYRIEQHDLTTEAGRLLLERVLKQLCADLQADSAATDCCRILRLPGTFNFKAKYGEPRPVVLEHCDRNAPTYLLAAFPLLPEPKKPVSEPRPYTPSNMTPDAAEVLRVMMNGGKAGKIGRLMSGDTSDFNGDASSADESLCNYLAFYCGPNGAAIAESLWRTSNLWRDKGDERHSADGRTYAQMTIDKAYAGRTEYWDWDWKPTPKGKQHQSEAPAPDISASADAPTDADAAQDTPQSDVPDTVTQAREFIAALWEQLAADPGAAYTPEALGHWALLYSNPAEWARLKPSLRQHKIAGRDLERAIKQQAQKEHDAQKQTTQDQTPDAPPVFKPLASVGDVLLDPPLKNLLVPRGYVLNEGGIQDTEKEIVAYSPVLIVRRLRDIDEKTESLCLMWKRPQGWQSIIVSRAVALNSQQIIGLADNGFPVSSDNARALVKWLHDFEAVNFALLPTQNVASHLGWQGANNEQGFLWGKTYITPQGERIETEGAEHAALKFHVTDPGAEQMAEAFHARGRQERWQQAISGIDRFAAVQLALYASFLPPLLPILDAANVIVDWANRTSTGKTTALRVAASVWGCADDRMPDSLINSWDATRVWIERASAMLNGLPLILDDTKRAKRPEQVASTLYDVANGRGKGRGSLKGTQRITRWRTVLLSTGEAPATGFTEDGGTRTRCVEIIRPPFGKDTNETAQIVRALNRAMVDNYGHAGPLFVQWLLKNRKEWPQYARAYRDFVREFDGQSGAASRMAEHLALFKIVAILLFDAGLVPWQYEGVPPELAKAILTEAEEASGELRALRHVISWAHNHQYNFIGREAKDSNGNKRDPQTVAGKWEDYEEADLCFLPSVLKMALQEGKFDADAIERGWREAGWLALDKDGQRLTKKVSINGAKIPHIVIRYEAIFQAED